MCGGWGNGGGNLYSSVSLQHLFITHCFEIVGSDRFDCSLVCWVFVVWFPFQHSSLLRCVLARWFLNAGFKDLPPNDQARPEIASSRSKAKDPKPKIQSQSSQAKNLKLETQSQRPQVREPTPNNPSQEASSKSIGKRNIIRRPCPNHLVF